MIILILEVFPIEQWKDIEIQIEVEHLLQNIKALKILLQVVLLL